MSHFSKTKRFFCKNVWQKGKIPEIFFGFLKIYKENFWFSGDIASVPSPSAIFCQKEAGNCRIVLVENFLAHKIRKKKGDSELISPDRVKKMKNTFLQKWEFCKYVAFFSKINVFFVKTFGRRVKYQKYFFGFLKYKKTFDFKISKPNNFFQNLIIFFKNFTFFPRFF